MTPSFESIFNRRQQAAFMRVCNAKLSCQSKLQSIRLLRVVSGQSVPTKNQHILGGACITVGIFSTKKRKNPLKSV